MLYYYYYIILKSIPVILINYSYEVYDVKLEQLYCPTLHLTRVQSDSNENDNSTTNDKEEEEARHKIKTLFSQSHSVTAKEGKYIILVNIGCMLTQLF